MNCTFFAFLVTHTLHGCAAVVVVVAAAVALVVALLENRYTCAIYPKTKRTAAVAAAKEAADLMTRLHSHNERTHTYTRLRLQVQRAQQQQTIHVHSAAQKTILSRIFSNEYI